jgi:AcrR family transcriptional regulator
MAPGEAGEAVAGSTSEAAAGPTGEARAADRPRSYDASGRQAAAGRNRAAILAAFRDLLFRDGYRAATVKAVADRAGVSAETVYKAFGGKPRLAKAVWDTTLAGDDAPTAMADRPELRAVLATADPREALAGWAAFVRGAHERLAALAAVLAEAGPEVAALVAATEDERLRGVRGFVDHLAAAGSLRPGADPSAAADACWALTSPHLWTRLTVGRGWSPAAYEEWLAEVLAATLL